MVALPELTAGAARLVIAPALGGAIARLDVAGKPVLRRWSGNADDPFTLACNVLVPFSNRISQGGFDWDGRHHAVAPNFAGDPFPIHGDGFQRVWDCTVQGSIATLTLDAGSIGPWTYHATQDFRLSDTSLSFALTMTNTGDLALPFGGGFHPWFPRSAQTRLSFNASGVWLEDETHLPTHHLDLPNHPGWNFAQPRPLPEGLINNGYTDWTGQARINQGADAVSCTITARSPLTTALVYSPGAASPFFCFEPVSHPVDAVHLPGHPGLTGLAPRESLTLAMRIDWSNP